MAFDNGYTAVTGGTLSAAQWNTYVRDNFTALWAYTAAGDLVYATSATALGRLAKGAYGKVLRMNSGATAPEWGGLPLVWGAAASESKFTWAGSGGAGSWEDVTGVSVAITVAVASTVLVFCYGNIGAEAGGQIRVSVDGTADTFEVGCSSDQNFPFSVSTYKASVAAGSRTCKLQATNTLANNMYVNRARIIAIALPE